MPRRLASKCLYGEEEDLGNADCYHAISYPIFQTAMFAHTECGQEEPYDYTRLNNPTRSKVEKVVCALENGYDAIAFSSGMAAIAALMEWFRPGDHILSGCDLYGGTIRLFRRINEKNGLVFDYLDTSAEEIDSYITPDTKAVYLETPTNPMMKVTDIRKVADKAHKYGIKVIVDNTFLSPYFQNPLDLGADVVIHSGTKYLCGHNDTIGGFLVSGSRETAEDMRELFKVTGSALAPFDSWLILRGIKTLSVRMERAQENAKKIVNWLIQNQKVKKVFYPGIENDPGYEIARKQARGFGCMITFEVESAELALTILNGVRFIHFAESLGGVETLVTYPMTQTHAEVPKEEREKNGITDKIIRMSVGIEDAEDILEDLEQAFEQYEKKGSQ